MSCAPKLSFGDETLFNSTELPDGCLRYLCTRIDGVAVQRTDLLSAPLPRAFGPFQCRGRPECIDA